MAERDRAIARFLEASGWGAAARQPLPGDASFRRYVRLTQEDGSRAMLMDAPPPKENVRPFLTVARLLHQMELSAPRIYAEDAEAGLLLLEDFGDDTFTRLLEKGADETALYTLAVDVLIAINRRFAGADLPPYDEARFLAEAELLVDWYLPAVSGQSAEPGVKERYLDIWRRALSMARVVPDTLVLRDFHVDNLMQLPGRTGVAACGLLDFQDAVVGPMSYDLMSLIEDARRDVPAALAGALTLRFLNAFPKVDRTPFVRSAAIIAAQRNCKIIGIFTRLCVRDGKPQYLKHIPRLWRLLENDLHHPMLNGLAGWLDRNIPPGLRIIPPVGPTA